MAEPDEQDEATEPTVTDVPEPDQPGPDEDEEAAEDEQNERLAEPEAQAAPPPSSEKEMKAFVKKIDGERERHATRINAILGDAATDVLTCPFCFEGLQGYVFPGDGQNLRDEQKTAALAFLGVEGGGEMPAFDGAVECTTCQGFGELRNPTKVPHYLTRSCPDCQGNGFRLKTTPAQNVVQFEPATTTTAYAPLNDVAPCPICGTAGSAGRPHFCSPQTAGMSGNA